MKLESLVIVNQHVTVNDLSNFAHTAHHARRVVLAGNYSEAVLFIHLAFYYPLRHRISLCCFGGALLRRFSFSLVWTCVYFYFEFTTVPAL